MYFHSLFALLTFVCLCFKHSKVLSCGKTAVYPLSIDVTLWHRLQQLLQRSLRGYHKLSIAVGEMYSKCC